MTRALPGERVRAENACQGEEEEKEGPNLVSEQPTLVTALRGSEPAQLSHQHMAGLGPNMRVTQV